MYTFYVYLCNGFNKTHYIYLACSLTFKFGLRKVQLKPLEMAEKVGQRDLRSGERKTSFRDYLT